MELIYNNNPIPKKSSRAITQINLFFERKQIKDRELEALNLRMQLNRMLEIE